MPANGQQTATPGDVAWWRATDELAGRATDEFAGLS